MGLLSPIPRLRVLVRARLVSARAHGEYMYFFGGGVKKNAAASTGMRLSATGYSRGQTVARRRRELRPSVLGPRREPPLVIPCGDLTGIGESAYVVPCARASRAVAGGCSLRSCTGVSTMASAAGAARAAPGQHQHHRRRPPPSSGGVSGRGTTLAARRRLRSCSNGSSTVAPSRLCRRVMPTPVGRWNDSLSAPPSPESPTLFGLNLGRHSGVDRAGAARGGVDGGDGSSSSPHAAEGAGLLAEGDLPGPATRANRGDITGAAAPLAVRPDLRPKVRGGPRVARWLLAEPAVNFMALNRRLGDIFGSNRSGPTC